MNAQVDPVRSVALLILTVLSFLPSSTDACHPGFEKELRYLDQYLGLRPADNGEIKKKSPSHFVSFVRRAKQLSCSFEKDCLWSNLPSDGLLDTSDFWHFSKSDARPWPQQLQPGKLDVSSGSHFIVAGNTTAESQSAVLLSAPIACQKKNGTLQFEYWLYNYAMLQVMVVKASRRRNHLQVIQKAQTDCGLYHEAGAPCVVTIPAVHEPFRIAIRAFSLHDRVIGSMAILTNIRFKADICDKSPLPSIFGSSALYSDLSRQPPLQSLSDLACTSPPTDCRWANAGTTKNAAWLLGTNTDLWHKLMSTSVTAPRPSGNFIFLAVDGLTQRPFARFVSDLIPCTKKPSTLTFKYWTKLGTQVEVCSIDEDDIPLSCAYLIDEDQPGPVNIDIDAFNKPFRFSFEIITFDVPNGGLAAIADLHVKGVLCSEELPPVATTVQPNTIANLLALTPRPHFNGVYSLQLDCDFTDPCYQWIDDEGKMLVGTAPEDSDDFPWPEETLQGNIAVFVMSGSDSVVLRSREVPCAYNLVVSLTYFRSENGFIRLCALGQCVDGNNSTGTLSLTLSSMRSFEVSIEIRSRGNSFVALDSISSEGDACPLKTIAQTICDNILCNFNGSLCLYDSRELREGDAPFVALPDGSGAVATIDTPYHRAFLASGRFELLEPALLVLSVTQETFGSRLLFCSDALADVDSCDELLGPRVLFPQVGRRLEMPLDVATKRFAIVALHDKALQFGPATFKVHSIEIRTRDDLQLCF